MTAASRAAPPAGARAQPGTLNTAQAERWLRMAAGVVLMVFVAMHLANHALGVFGVAVMEAVQDWRVALWRTRVGTVLLYGALAVHIVLALKRAVSRRTLRMPFGEALQIMLGLAIPILLWRHVVDTRVIGSFGHIDESYVHVLRFLFPEHALWQSLLLLVVWAHGCIGLRFMLRYRPWFVRWRTGLYVAAFALPLLALAGFVAGGREAHTMTVPMEAWNANQIAIHETATLYGRIVAGSVLLLPLLLLAGHTVAMRLKAEVTVNYVGHGDKQSSIGPTLLEMSRLNGIPHAGMCGGRGRCGTCRVLLLSDIDSLPPPAGLERVLLDRIKAPSRVRLACQIRPVRDLRVKILLPARISAGTADFEDEALKWGTERQVAVLFADIRGFSTLARTQLPQDLVVLLNRVIEDMTQAVGARGGETALVLTDGVMAVFGATTTLGNASRAAVAAAEDILRAVAAANEDIGGALPQPLRVGIGVHSGAAVVAHLGDEQRGYSLGVLGETVLVASRLEEATKEIGADCVISDAALDAAGLRMKSGSPHQLHYKNCDAPVTVRAFANAGAVAALFK